MCAADPQAEDPGLGVQRELAVHPEVPGEPGGQQVAGAVLDPPHGPAQEERRGDGDDVAGIQRHLVAEGSADVG